MDSKHRFNEKTGNPETNSKIKTQTDSFSADSLQEIMHELDAFNKERDWDQFHSPANLSKSIVIESAELLECFQWNDDKYSMEKVKEELADVLLYCLQLAQKLDLDPIAIMQAKLERNAKKYPADKCRGSSKKYDEL